MEICTVRNLPTIPLTLSSYSPHFRFLPTLPLNKSSHFSGIAFRRRATLLRVTSDDESSKFTEDGKDGVATLEDVPTVDSGVNQSVFNGSRQSDGEQSLSDESEQPFQEFLSNLGIKLDSEDSSVLFLYGGGSLFAVWLLSAVVGAIDSIPVVPKLMEVVGLGYSIWFTTRYLLFKKNRQELTAKIDELKQEILGSGNKTDG